MNIRKSRRAAVLERVADHMLAHGLALSSVRALAQAAGTSDRMLFYYFADKDEIVVEALRMLSLRLAAALPSGPPRAADDLLAELSEVVRGPAMRPYMRLFLELVILSGRGEEPYRRVAGGIADGFLAWIAARLDSPDGVVAARLIALLDGAVVLDMIGRDRIADAALGAAYASRPRPDNAEPAQT
jgi:AcrR family transcriptional regulator